MTQSSRLLAFLTVLFAPALARGERWTVPGLSNSPGRNGTFFVSELKLRNAGAAATTASFELLPLSGTAPASAARTIAAGATLVLPNALQELFGPGDRAGTVRVTSDQTLFISARTYNNADPSGTFGFAAEAVPESALLTAGETGHVGWVSDSGNGVTGFRTNVGVVLGSPGSSVDLVVLGADGLELGRRNFNGGPLATQLAVRNIASGNLSVARLELRVLSGTVTGYSSVVDNVTGDGFAIFPERSSPGTFTDVVLNGVSRGPGRFGTLFRTDVRLVNPGASPRAVTISGLSLFASGQPISGESTVTVPAQGSAEWLDILGALFSAPQGTIGSLRFETDGPLLVLGRTSNVRPDGATFGASQKATRFPAFLARGSVGTYVGLIQSGASPGFRTNIGFAAGAAGAVVDLVLRDRGGAEVGNRPAAVSLPSYGFTQPSLGNLFPGTAIPQDSTLEVRVADGTVDTYASFLDNGTGDSAIFSASFTNVAVPPNFTETSPCPPNPGSAGLINDGTNLFRVTIDPARYPDALCNDGSPGVFFVRKGTATSANRWFVYLEGGGECFDAATCQNRWCSKDTNFGAAKMSSRYAPELGIGGGGILAVRPDNAFGEFNAVWVYYCSSDTWTGRVRDRVLLDSTTGRSYSIHFAGAHILDAVLSELRAGVTYRDASNRAVAMPSLDDAEVVLLIGESAGGGGVLTNADRVGQYLARTNRTGRLAYRAVADASSAPSNEEWPTYEEDERGRWALTTARLGGRVEESCVSHHPNDSWRCADRAHLRLHHIATPLFVRNDLIDPNRLDGFGTPEWPFGSALSQFAQATWDTLDATSRIRSTSEEKASLTVDPGVYGPHCDNHTAMRNNGKFFQDKVAVAGGSMSFHDTLRNWLLGMMPRVVMEPRPTGDPVPKSAICTVD